MHGPQQILRTLRFLDSMAEHVCCGIPVEHTSSVSVFRAASCAASIAAAFGGNGIACIVHHFESNTIEIDRLSAGRDYCERRLGQQSSSISVAPTIGHHVHPECSQLSSRKPTAKKICEPKLASARTLSVQRGSLKGNFWRF